MLGLFRPIRRQAPTETPDEFVQAVKAARSGHADPESVLDPDSMGVVAMKLRYFGAREGRRYYLRFNMGAIEDFPLERDRRAR